MRTPPVSGYRGRPPRPCLARVERGNPVGVRAFRPGRPTVRGAELPGGNRMVQEANAGGRKAAGTRDAVVVSSDGRPENRPDTGLVAGPERVLTWSR